VHRLDKDTSGLLVVARTLPAHTALVRMLGDRSVHREYEAVCRGVMTAGGTVDAPIERHPTERVRMAVREGGREAVTHYRVIRRFRPTRTCACSSRRDGRTRSACTSRMRLPDRRRPCLRRALALPRGSGEDLRRVLREFPRQALHAARLQFDHP